jgi:hypothetical protein
MERAATCAKDYPEKWKRCGDVYARKFYRVARAIKTFRIFSRCCWRVRGSFWSPELLVILWAVRNAGQDQAIVDRQWKILYI